jgi:hypothetical protein
MDSDNLKNIQLPPYFNLVSFCQKEKITTPADFWDFWFEWKTSDVDRKRQLIINYGLPFVREYSRLLDYIIIRAKISIRQDCNELNRHDCKEVNRQDCN